MNNKSFSPQQAKEELPPVPSGHELLDMAWRDLSVVAAPLLAELASEGDLCVDPKASAAALFRTWKAYTTAAAALATTRERSVLWRFRSRAARTQWERFTNLANGVLCALFLAAQRDYQTGQPEQVFLLARDRFRDLLKEMCREEEP